MHAASRLISAKGNCREHSVNIIFWAGKDVAEAAVVEYICDKFHGIASTFDNAIITLLCDLRKKDWLDRLECRPAI